MPDLIRILTEESMMSIWLRLPIKSTVRFRCVLKSWCASLSDPQFIYKNLTSLGADENDHDLLLVLDCNKQFYSVVSHETLMATPVASLSPLQVSPLREVPSADEFDKDVTTYSCDDLVCFHNEYGTTIGVWNLTTGETKILPFVSEFGFITLGFGFDDKIQDYKMVQIRRDAVYVYSLYSGNNSWRKLDEPNVPEHGLIDPYHAHGGCYSYSYRDGIFYWCNSNDLIVSFDMSTEVFSTISIPQHPHPLESLQIFCKLKDGSMLIVSLTDDDYDDDGDYSPEYDLWALLEVGESPSLTKLFRIDWHCEREFPLGFWRNELIFYCFKDHPGLLIGDPSSIREPKEVQIDEPFRILSCLPWTKGKNSVPFN